MHQPPNARLPSYRELYGPRFVVMVLCWVVSVLLTLLSLGWRVLSTVLADMARLVGEPFWTDTAAHVSDAIGVVSLVSCPVLLTVALVLLASQDLVEPQLLPPWTTRERLRTARVLAVNAVLSNDPWANLLARSYAGRVSSWSSALPRSLMAISLACSGLMAVGGVFLLLRAVRSGDPNDMAIGLNTALLFAGFAVLPLALAPRRRRMREFCALYDAARQRAAR